MSIQEISEEYLHQNNYCTFAPIWVVSIHNNDEFPKIFLLEKEAEEYLEHAGGKGRIRVCSIPPNSALLYLLKTSIDGSSNPPQYRNILGYQ
jgi:hypothetical protein